MFQEGGIRMLQFQVKECAQVSRSDLQAPSPLDRAKQIHEAQDGLVLDAKVREVKSPASPEY